MVEMDIAASANQTAELKKHLRQYYISRYLEYGKDYTLDEIERLVDFTLTGAR